LVLLIAGRLPTQKGHKHNHTWNLLKAQYQWRHTRFPSSRRELHISKSYSRGHVWNFSLKTDNLRSYPQSLQINITKQTIIAFFHTFPTSARSILPSDNSPALLLPPLILPPPPQPTLLLLLLLLLTTTNSKHLLVRVITNCDPRSDPTTHCIESCAQLYVA
jgi:hypothetical protein